MVTGKEIDAVAVFDRYGAVAVELNFFCGVRRYVALGNRFWLATHMDGPLRHIIRIRGFAGTASLRRRPS